LVDPARRAPPRSTGSGTVEFIGDDELMEITPKSIRLRKHFLKEHGRRRVARGAA
jgi:GTP-binding protein